MKILNKFLKAIQTAFGKNASQKQSSKATQVKGALFSNDSKSLLHIINNKDNESLFI